MRRSRYWLILSLVLGFGVVVQADAQETALPLSGRIAFIGTDRNLYTYIPQEDRTIPLTTDGSSSQIYQWPTWSSDGRLAYFVTSVRQSDFSTQVMISPDGEAPGSSVYESGDEFFTYAYWSPQNCSSGDNCRDLAVLFSQAGSPQFNVRLIRDGAQSAETLIGQGAPFYYSWSPDGTRMMWSRNNQRVDIYDVASEALLETLSQTPGIFQSPGWSPVADRWLFGALSESGRATNLVVVVDGQEQMLASNLSGLVSFSWSPDGSSVAYSSAQGPLTVVDSQTGEVVAQSSVNGVISFFWSPDSKRIAYLTLAAPPGSSNADANSDVKAAALVQETLGIAWSVLDVDTGATRRYESFLPTREMIYLLSFFDQFAQSHRVWSPDNRLLVYSAITPDGAQTVRVLDATRSDSVSFSIADGLIGIWSFS